MKTLGIRIIITQETDETSHYLFEIFNVKRIKNINEDLEENCFINLLNKFKKKSLKLIKNMESEINEK